jgi:hypothetical protein
MRERREIDQGSFEANHARKMKWIEDVRARVQIAELTEKANEQHYEVRYYPLPIRLWDLLTLRQGSDEIHPHYSGSVRKIFVLSLSDGERNSRRSGSSHTGELLPESTAERRTGRPRSRLWMGQPVALPGAEIPEFKDYRFIQFHHPESPHRCYC